MKKQYVLGVDGGNTKTHYFLYDTAGNYVDCLCAGTCSHEPLPDSFDGTRREIGNRTAELFTRNGITSKDVAFAAFGLAGADFEWQKAKLSAVVESLGFSSYVLDNDGFLALKAGSKSGVGIGSINGTGTVTVGVNEKGERMQVGGIGEISGDKAGAVYIATRGVGAIYDSLYRMGKNTLLKDLLFSKFSIADDRDFAYAATKILNSKEGIYKVNLLREEAETEGDEAVVSILSDIGKGLASSVAGCIHKLHFTDTVEVVLAGSVWVKSKFESMRKAFEELLSSKCKISFIIRYLKQPPAIGAVIWALEEYKRKNNSTDSLSKESVLRDKKLLSVL